MIAWYFLFNLVISDVQVNARWTDSALIIKTSGFNVGDEFSERMLQQAIWNLNRLRLFNSISIDTTIIGDGILIRITAIEAPFLKGNLEFIGNEKVKSKDLRKKADLREGQLLTDKVLFDAKMHIENFYAEKTFFNTTVSESLVQDTLNQARLFFIIREGTPLRIGTITIEGNSFFTDGAIRRKMQNKAKGFLRSGRLDKEKLKEDVERIKAFYKENGFLDIQVDEPQIEVEKNCLAISITVRESRRYYVGDVTFEGNKLFTTPQLVKVLKYETGDIYNLAKVQNTLVKYYEMYADEGYISCGIVPVEDVNDSIISIKYIVNEGAAANIERVIITGNYRTREKVIRREIFTMPGERFRRSLVVRSMREVFNLGYFEDIAPEWQPTGDSGNIDMIYKVKEKEGVGSVGAGMSYSAQDKLTGYIELSHPNMFGRGQRLYTKLEVGGRLTNIQLGFTEPWLFDTRTTAGAELYYTNRFWDYYTKRDIGTAASLGLPFFLDYSRFNYTFRVERTQILDIASSYVPSSTYDLRNDTIPKWTLANTFGLTRDTRDFIFNPSSGSYISLQTEISKPWFFANIDYNRFTFEARSYFPVFWKFVLMARIKTGIVTSSKEVPIYKRFYAGGTGDEGVRGYSDRSLAPTEGGRAIGGNALFINNLELKLKLSQSFALLAFYDMGNSFVSYKDINLHDLYRGAGVGIRVEIPMMGVLGFDLGYGFDRAIPGFEPHFQINPFGMF